MSEDKKEKKEETKEVKPKFDTVLLVGQPLDGGACTILPNVKLTGFECVRTATLFDMIRMGQDIITQAQIEIQNREYFKKIAEMNAVAEQAKVEKAKVEAAKQNEREVKPNAEEKDKKETKEDKEDKGNK